MGNISLCKEGDCLMAIHELNSDRIVKINETTFDIHSPDIKTGKDIIRVKRKKE